MLCRGQPKCCHLGVVSPGESQLVPGEQASGGLAGVGSLYPQTVTPAGAFEGVRAGGAAPSLRLLALDSKATATSWRGCPACCGTSVSISGFCPLGAGSPATPLALITKRVSGRCQLPPYRGPHDRASGSVEMQHHVGTGVLGLRTPEEGRLSGCRWAWPLASVSQEFLLEFKWSKILRQLGNEIAGSRSATLGNVVCS